MSADSWLEIDERPGAKRGEEDKVNAADRPEIDVGVGANLALLDSRCASWRDIQQARLAAEQRDLPDLAELLKKVEDRAAEDIKKALRAHPVWSWLSQFPGLGGVHVADLVAMIGDPRRFPGQKCTEGHTAPPDFEVGDPCPVVGFGTEDACPGFMLPPRETTGTRALWHNCGLHVVDGRSPRKRKGHRVDWDPAMRTAVLMPSGIADAIVRNRVPVYRDEYDRKKAQLIETRAEVDAEVALPGGSQEGEEAEQRPEIDVAPGLRPFQIDAIARKVAAKMFVGDLLRELKRVAGVAGEIRRSDGDPCAPAAAALTIEIEKSAGGSRKRTKKEEAA